jgi:conjugal transfer pilus assembly protein TraD
MEINYFNIWRPAYEFLASSIWFIFALVAYLLGKHFGHNLQAISFISLPFLVFAMIRFVQGFKIIWHKLEMNYDVPLMLDFESILEEQKKNNYEYIILGKGFKWEPRHVQMTEDLKSIDSEQIQPPNWLVSLAAYLNQIRINGIKCAYWLHSYEKEEFVKVQLDHLNSHIYTPGTTGAGKTRMAEVIFGQAIHLPERPSVIVLDPKSDAELRDRLYTECERENDTSRFLYFSPTNYDKSVRVNVLADYNNRSELADRISGLMIGGGESEQFKQFAWLACNAVINALFISGETPSLKLVKKYIEGGVDELLTNAVAEHARNIGEGNAFDTNLKLLVDQIVGNKFTEEQKKAMAAKRIYEETLKQACPAEEIESIINIFKHPREHFQKLVISLIPTLNMLTSGPIGELLSPDIEAVDSRQITTFSKILKNGNVLYAGLDCLSNQAVGQAIGSLFIAGLTAQCAERQIYPDKKNKKLFLFCDEVNQLANDHLIEILNKGRSSFYHVILSGQTFGDLARRLGDEFAAHQVLGNTNSTIAMRTLDQATKEQIGVKFGTTNKKEIEVGIGTQGFSSSEDMDFGGNYNKRTATAEVDYVSGDSLHRLPPLHYFLNLPGGERIKGRFPFVKPNRCYIDDLAANNKKQKSRHKKYKKHPVSS